MQAGDVTKKGVLSRLLITLIGAALILWSVGLFSLFVAGEKQQAVVTSVRRDGGQKKGAVPNRYIYKVSYTFTADDGRRIDGFSTVAGKAVYFNASPSSTAAVRYFSFFPYFNSLENETEPGFKMLIYIAAGCLLIWAVNRKPRKRARRSVGGDKNG